MLPPPPMILVALLPLLLCPLLLLLGLCYAVLGEPYRPVFKRHKVKMPASWPEHLNVVHISDLHVRSGDLRLYRAQLAALDGLRPDVLCVTGDICEKVSDIHLVVDLLRMVRPRLGTFVVLGNHEHNAPAPAHVRETHRRGWRRAVAMLLEIVAPRERSDGEEEGHAMADALTEAGITVLHNAGRRVKLGDQSVWIAGCDSAWAGHADMVAAMQGRRENEACLALIHEPDLAFEARALGADLILAGHTHGGQVRLPLLGAPYSLRMDPRIVIAAGFQRIEESVLHITAGLGQTIPLRFGCPPEVVWLDVQGSPVTLADQAHEQVLQRLV